MDSEHDFGRLSESMLLDVQKLSAEKVVSKVCGYVLQKVVLLVEVKNL